LVSSARTYAEQNSQALKKFRQAIQNHGKNAITQFELTDVNKDGVVNIDGFKVVMLVPEFNMNSTEVEEAFYILQGISEGFPYRDWIAQYYPQHKKFFSVNAQQSMTMTAQDPLMSGRPDIQSSYGHDA
jgi:hypothetical protein